MVHNNAHRRLTAAGDSVFSKDQSGPLRDCLRQELILDMKNISLTQESQPIVLCLP